ncbi:hypothetical protein GCM10009127_28550 [Alteraurantiacibacter aestuarii]
MQAQEVVQQLPNPASERLNEALRRLSRAPESLPALIAAGRASLELGDVDAAAGFFVRARAVSPDDGAVLSGLALVSLRQEDPVAALDLFDRAQAAGENLDGYAADRGLAFDLIGQNARAQELYGQALSRDENAETVRRLALSYAIAGDQAASEAILLPLLQRRDLAAYRTRAFALAILGREDEAVSIAETMLPPRISRRMGPYLRYMQRLTPAQQAAAANLGSFPRAADIGRDEPRLARNAATPLPSSPSSNVDARLIPGGPALGSAALGSAAEELPALASAEPVVPEPEAQPSFSISEEVPAQAAVVAVADPAPTPAATPAPTPTPTPSPTPAATVVAEEEPVSLADVFADFSLEEEAAAPVAAPGAVDITAIVPVREQKAPEPPPPPAHPSRHWVQVATGQDLAAFRFDWRRLVRNADGLLDNRSAYRARWNQTNRLLTGPFDSARAAQEFVTALGNAGVDAFRFTSAEGEEVTALN